MAKVTTRNCPKCGAPLNLTPGISDVACQYCGTVVHVEWGKKPPPEAQQPPLTVYVSNPMPACLPIVIALTVLIPLGGSLFAFLGTRAKDVASEAVQAVGLPAPEALSTTLPATCGLNQEISIVGRKFEGPGPLITGEVNCKIKIKDSTLKSDVVVLAKNLVEITVENSTLEGKENAVKLSMNSKLFGKKQTVFKGAEAAILAGNNSEITLDDSTVEGGEAGIQGETNIRLSAQNSKISGGEYGLRSGTNLTVEGKELTLSGKRAGIEGQVNLTINLRGGLVQGEEAAIRSKGPNVELKLSKGARVKGKEVALKVESNLELEMEESTIESEENAIEAGVNPKLTLGSKARIVAKQVALKVGVNLELDMRGATIESESVGICAPFNIEIEARESTIKGIEAFRFERKPRTLELVQSNVVGRQRFDARGCGLR